LTTLILWAGLGLAAAVAWLMRRPEWRIPALVFAVLALPGNIDNLLPQMRLDPHPLPSSTAPVASVVDLLIVWALVLTWREGGSRRLSGKSRRIVLGGLVVALLASATAAVAIVSGVDAAAGIRGMLTFARIPALLFIVLALRQHLVAGELLSIGVAGGLASLLANGIYTSGAQGLTRFTAATFGRNGFSMALVACALVCAGAGFQAWGRRDRLEGLRSVAMLGLAAAAFFAAIATGTRMALLALVGALLLALLVNRSWLSRAGVVRVGTVAAAMILIAISAALWTAEGGRALAVLTDPGGTADIVFDPGNEPAYSPVRARTHFWEMAIEMAAAHPLTGVGPYQWNVERYEIRAAEPEAVLDVHNAYLQIAAEYGGVVLAAYLALLAVLLGLMLRAALRRPSPIGQQWSITLLSVAAMVYPVTELTNSHLFNIRLGALGWLLLALTLAIVVRIDGERSTGEGRPAIESS